MLYDRTLEHFRIMRPQNANVVSESGFHLIYPNSASPRCVSLAGHF